MIKKPDTYRRYNSAQTVYKSAFSNFFACEFPKLFGPVMREKLADELLTLVANLYPETQRLKPGQVVWNALDQTTRATSPRRRDSRTCPFSYHPTGMLNNSAQGTPMAKNRP